jgi:putative redox protein
VEKINWIQFRIKNNRDQHLAALLLRSKSEPDSGRQETGKNPLVIVCHGFTGSKESRGQALAMGEELALLGYGTLLFDFAGSWESDGEDRDRTLSGQVDDLAAIVRWARQKGFGPIILSGRSFGGSTVLSYAARDQQIDAVCTWAAVTRLERLFLPLIGGSAAGPAEELVTIKSEEGQLALKRRFFQDLSKHDLVSCAAAISPRSLLIVHGSADQSVPVEDAEILYQAAGEPKKLVIIEGADHRFSGHTEKVWQAFFSWLAKVESDRS